MIAESVFNGSDSNRTGEFVLYSYEKCVFSYIQRNECFEIVEL
jgi:hypothetical protein